MPYRYSQIDKSNLEWFDKDVARATLMRLEIYKGKLRGVGNIKLHFRYPITAVSGRNGTGKSTILACAACAYHNHHGGFKTLTKRFPYYTFSEFFVQAAEEIPPTGIEIRYQFLYNNWRKSRNVPTGTGLAWQTRRKRLLGKWNNYDGRVPRSVVFLGIERVVPHAEKSVFKSYRRAFKKLGEAGYEKLVKETVGRILGRTYDEFYYKQHSKYRLPLVKSKVHTYSGFNMGAGENALFEIFSTIYACPESLLLVVDELELGLHEEAQVRLIDELKELCKVRHIQIICTTHSPRILASLPPEGRIHLEPRGSNAVVMPEISPKYASGLLSGHKDAELNIYCEDEMARDILLLALPNEIRGRVEIIPIGSAAAVVRQLVARYKEASNVQCCGFLDGDKVLKKQEHVNLFLKEVESVPDAGAATQWIENRLRFLPGNTWPEKWLLEKQSGACKELAEEFRISHDTMAGYIEDASSGRRHAELYRLSQRLNLTTDTLKTPLIRYALDRSPDAVAALSAFVRGFLD